MPDVAPHPDELVWSRLRRFILDAAARQADPASVLAVADAVDGGAVTLRVDGETMVVAVAGQELCWIELEALGL